MARKQVAWTDDELRAVLSLITVDAFGSDDVYHALRVRYGSRVPGADCVLRHWQARRWIKRGPDRSGYVRCPLVEIEAWGL